MFGSACRPMRVGKLSPSGRLLQKAILSISGPTERASGRGRRRRREGKETQGAFEVANLIIIYMYMYSITRYCLYSVPFFTLFDEDRT